MAPICESTKGVLTRVRMSSAAALLVAAVVMTGCTQASQSKADNPVISAPQTSSSATGSTSTDPARPTVTPTKAVPSLSQTPTPASTPPRVPIDGPDGCPTASLKIAVLRASGAAGHQYAYLQFTNTSAKSCSLTGFPGVQLLRAGAPLGQPAARSAAQASRVQIAPQAAVTAQLVDDSTCNADNADSVQIIPPNRTDRIVLPISLRGCPLQVGPVSTG